MINIFSRVFVIILISKQFLSAQKFTIEGIIYDKKSKETLPGASILIENTKIGTSTDLNGKFCLTNVNKGNYNLIISYVGYKTDTIKNLMVKSNLKNLEIFLEENSLSLNEVSVIATRKTDSENSIIQEIKLSLQVVNGVSSEQISKTQDKSANEVIKRLPGITLLENRLLIIRGLAERYNSTYINNSIAPSMEIDKNSFSFDILPSNIISRILVYKTASPELPGNFTGGFIKIETKNNVDSNFYSFTIGQSYNNYTTFKKILSDNNTILENLMLTRNSRNLPDDIPHNLNVLSRSQLYDVTKKLKNNWDLKETFAYPDVSFNFTIGKKFGNLSSTTTFGFSENKQKYYSNIYNYNSYDIENQQSQIIYSYTDNINTTKHRIAGMQNFNYNINSKNFIKFNNLIIANNSNQIINRQGTNYEEGMKMNSYSYNYNERKIINSQLTGNHILGKNEKAELSWTTFYTISTNNQPDYKKIRTMKSSDDNESTSKYQVIIPPSASILDAGRFYGFLKDKSYGVFFDFKNSIDTILTIKAGAGASQKSRIFNARWMSYKKANNIYFNQSLLFCDISTLFSEENITETGFILEEGTNPADKYFSYSNNLFNYYSFTLNYLKKTIILTGIRFEYYKINLISRNYSNEPVNANLENFHILPSLTLTYTINDDNKCRLSFYKSINNPEFRELAPFAFYDFRYNNVLIGNSNLKNATIYNYEIKYENINKQNDMINIGMFYKNFLNPIELYYIPGAGSGGTRNFTFKNAIYANNIGAEIEVRNNLTYLLPNNKLLSNFYITSNMAIVYSNVQLGDEARGQKKTRPLMYQSPYIINAGLFYENLLKQFQFNIVYYILGKRLFAVGTFGTSDIYELPRNDLNITFSKKINKYSKINFAIYNVLNNYYTLKQDSNNNGKIDNNDETIEKYKTGITVSIGYNITF